MTKQNSVRPFVLCLSFVVLKFLHPWHHLYLSCFGPALSPVSVSASSSFCLPSRHTGIFCVCELKGFRWKLSICFAEHVKHDINVNPLSLMFFLTILHISSLHLCAPWLDGAFGLLGVASEGDHKGLGHCPVNLTCLPSHHVHVYVELCVCLRPCCVESEGGSGGDRWLVVWSRLVFSACQRSGENSHSTLYFTQPHQS